MKKFFGRVYKLIKYDLARAYKTRSRRVLLACSLSPWIMILIEMIVLCSLDRFPWFLALMTFLYCLLLIFDAEHLLCIGYSLIDWIILTIFTFLYFIPKFTS